MVNLNHQMRNFFIYLFTTLFMTFTFMNRLSMEQDFSTTSQTAYAKIIKSNLHPSKAEIKKSSSSSQDLVSLDDDIDVQTLENDLIFTLFVGAIAVGLFYTLSFLKRTNKNTIPRGSSAFYSIKRFILIRSIRI